MPQYSQEDNLSWSSNHIASFLLWASKVCTKNEIKWWAILFRLLCKKDIASGSLSTDSAPNLRAQIDVQMDNDGNCYTALIVTNENVIDLVAFNSTVIMWKMPSTCIIALANCGSEWKNLPCYVNVVLRWIYKTVMEQLQKVKPCNVFLIMEPVLILTARAIIEIQKPKVSFAFMVTRWIPQTVRVIYMTKHILSIRRNTS